LKGRKSLMGSFKTKGSFKKICELWPILSAIAVTVLNIDFILTPALIKLEIPIFLLLSLLYVVSTLELRYWFWFWTWAWDLFFPVLIHIRKVSEDIALVKEFGTELKEKGYLARAKILLFKIINGALDEKNIIVKFIKWGGAFSLILIGASPESGSRIIGIIFCKMFRWKNGFYPLALGNLIHVTYIVLGWKYLGLFRMALLFLILMVISYVVKKLFTKK
jgi:hypothetical protein